jgi:predicted lipoprotein with Yx(FWY)xxD motif
VLAVVAFAAPAGPGTVVEAVASRYGPVLAWQSSPGVPVSFVYEFSGDTNGTLGCSTQPMVRGLDVPTLTFVTASCTGPESDYSSGVTSDDWPALTTTGPPVAGPGVTQALLGTVKRPGIGEQVTYAGHPLYLFDPPGAACAPCGTDYIETVFPLLPWHGIWYAVSAKDGRPAPGRATMGAERLPNGKTVLAAGVFPLSPGVRATVYALSGQRGPGACTGECAINWIPLLTTGKPKVAGGVKSIAAKNLGVVPRADGTSQATYRGRPLYLYSQEKFIGLSPPLTGTAGNGNGLPSPGGRFSVIQISPSRR